RKWATTSTRCERGAWFSSERAALPGPSASRAAFYYRQETEVTKRQRAEEMERARAKRLRKKAKKGIAPEPAGAVDQVKELAKNTAQSVGAVVRSATEAITGGSSNNEPLLGK